VRRESVKLLSLRATRDELDLGDQVGPAPVEDTANVAAVGEVRRADPEV
jgi:hypothetical protein